jgi:hypothetical protein
LFIPNPAGHLIHHSAELRHRDKNLSEGLPLWDLLLGTLYIPRMEEHFKIGVRDRNGLKWVPKSVSYVLFGSVADGIRTAIHRSTPVRAADVTQDGIQNCWCGSGCKKLGYAFDNPAPAPSGLRSWSDIWAATKAWVEIGDRSAECGERSSKLGA